MISTLPVFPISTYASCDFIGSLSSLRRRNIHKCRSPDGYRVNSGCITYTRVYIPHSLFLAGKMIILVKIVTRNVYLAQVAE